MLYSVLITCHNEYCLPDILKGLDPYVHLMDESRLHPSRHVWHAILMLQQSSQIDRIFSICMWLQGTTSFGMRHYFTCSLVVYIMASTLLLSSKYIIQFLMHTSIIFEDNRILYNNFESHSKNQHTNFLLSKLFKKTQHMHPYKH